MGDYRTNKSARLLIFSTHQDLKELKDKKGASLPAIKKYVAANYKIDIAKSGLHIRKAIKPAAKKSPKKAAKKPAAKKAKSPKKAAAKKAKSPPLRSLQQKNPQQRSQQQRRVRRRPPRKQHLRKNKHYLILLYNLM